VRDGPESGDTPDLADSPELRFIAGRRPARGAGDGGAGARTAPRLHGDRGLGVNAPVRPSDHEAVCKMAIGHGAAWLACNTRSRRSKAVFGPGITYGCALVCMCWPMHGWPGYPRARPTCIIGFAAGVNTCGLMETHDSRGGCRIAPPRAQHIT
jgi:hypothetical protein